jgi:hypothetical protein
MHARIQIASIAFALIVFVTVFELVRRRRLRERYALVWMAAALGLVVLAVWQGLLTAVSKAVGIYYPPNAPFVAAFGFLLLLLLQLSAAVSRLSDQTTVLAQRLALLEERGHPEEPSLLPTEEAGIAIDESDACDDEPEPAVDAPDELTIARRASPPR